MRKKHNKSCRDIEKMIQRVLEIEPYNYIARVEQVYFQYQKDMGSPLKRDKEEQYVKTFRSALKVDPDFYLAKIF